MKPPPDTNMKDPFCNVFKIGANEPFIFAPPLALLSGQALALASAAVPR